jgi:hypothetical protein
MKEKKMNITNLEKLLCEGSKIADMLEPEFEALRVDALGQSYTLNEDVKLNNDFKRYTERKAEEMRQEIKKKI